MCSFVLYIVVCVRVCVPFHQVQPQLSTVRQRHQLQTGGHAHLTFNLWSHSDYPRHLEDRKGLQEAVNHIHLFYLPLLVCLTIVCVYFKAGFSLSDSPASWGHFIASDAGLKSNSVTHTHRGLVCNSSSKHVCERLSGVQPLHGNRF